MPETWRLLIHEPAGGAANMARDEAILVAHASGAMPPTLRLYRWSPACLSLGRFQRGDEIDRAACMRAGVAVVRRPSGGRALLHDDELTYAIVARTDQPLFGGQSILETYRQISLALLAGLRKLGVVAELTPTDRRPPTAEDKETRRQGRGTIYRAPTETRRQRDRSDSNLPFSPSPLLRVSRSSAACFDTPATYELTVAGRKLAGSAQTRRAGSLLQHGAIPLAPHAERLAALLRAPPPDLGAKMIALDQAAGRAIDFDEAARAIASGFEEAWGITLRPGELTDAEQSEETRLLDEKYGDDRWTYVR